MSIDSESLDAVDGEDKTLIDSNDEGSIEKPELPKEPQQQDIKHNDNGKKHLDYEYPLKYTPISNRPVRKYKHRKFKSLFKPRQSYLDFERLMMGKNEFRGFFILFWVGLGFKTLITLYEFWKVNGSLISFEMISMVGEHGIDMLKSDLAMVLSTFTFVFFQKFIVYGIVPLKYASQLQHVIQAIWYLFYLVYCYTRPWGWIQKLYFVLHLTANLMKSYSYNSYNINLHYRLIRYHALQNQSLVDIHISNDLLTERDDLFLELTTEHGGFFPSNLTFTNFIDFQLVPSLVYEIKFPRTEKFRLWYFMERLCSGIIAATFLFLTIQHSVMPVFDKLPQQSFIDSFLELIIPFMICWLLMFFLLFDCITNFFAEITCFADRQFYSDWWNSPTYDAFARDWNKPVHQFLLRHCYQESMTNLMLSKQEAMLLTFFISSLVHELVVLMLGGKFRFYLFGMQMFQIPLIYISSLKMFKGYELAGNCFFWFGMYIGPPLMTVGYLREIYV
ncbi:MBOAT, membrane-bound O-acyltransferase family-domain-containing protein [Globomyces pollinis-pini]|nr:MBOAT, membrane-bound O-acyltransferase family-domain-containing protein [Globomyces pollinis-pini]